MSDEQDWVPASCTLPTPERPLRVAEFDVLFATALRRQERPDPTVLRWTFDPGAEESVRDLTARESGCCGFFTFTVAPAADHVEVRVEVPATQVTVLDALAVRAAARIGR